MATLEQTYRQELEKHLYNLQNNPDYARELETRSQKLKRARNIATRCAAAAFMRDNKVGYSRVQDDVVRGPDRCMHYGVSDGTVIGKIRFKARDYDQILARTIRKIRKNCY
jgi:hypothetical protein